MTALASTPLSPDDLSFWYADQPRQRTTMAMLLLLDRRPDPERLRAAAARMVEAVPRLRQRVVEAPFGLALPRWEDDPTFDLDFHVRRYSLADGGARASELDELFHTIGPIYERPFDRTRPLWEMIEIDRNGAGAAIFFRLHHAVADGVGGNAILAALTDATREGEPLPPPSEKPPGAWSETGFGAALSRAVRDRIDQDRARAGAVAGALWQALREPASIVRAARIVGGVVQEFGDRSESPLRDFGRARRLTGLEIDFERLTEAKRALGGLDRRRDAHGGGRRGRRLASRAPAPARERAEDAGADQSAPARCAGARRGRRQSRHGHRRPPASAHRRSARALARRSTGAWRSARRTRRWSSSRSSRT